MSYILSLQEDFFCFERNISNHKSFMPFHDIKNGFHDIFSPKRIYQNYFYAKNNKSK